MKQTQISVDKSEAARNKTSKGFRATYMYTGPGLQLSLPVFTMM